MTSQDNPLEATEEETTKQHTTRLQLEARHNTSFRILMKLFVDPCIAATRGLDDIIQHLVNHRKHPEKDPNLPVEFDEWLAMAVKYRNATYRIYLTLMWMMYSKTFRDSMLIHEGPKMTKEFMTILGKVMDYSVYGLKIENGGFYQQTGTDRPQNQLERSVGYAVCYISSWYVLRC